MKPFLRWVGSKYRCRKQIISEFPKEFNNYFEPFLGSGAIYFSLNAFKIKWKKSYLSDINKNLINTYRAVRDEPERVTKVLETYLEKNSEEFYYKMRKNVNTPAGMLYLNRACFSSLYRVNKDGGFNVPYRKQDFVIMGKKISKDLEPILKCSRYLNVNKHDEQLDCIKWEYSLTYVNAGDVVYLDPPYVPYKDDGFVNYDETGFSRDQHVLLNNYSKVFASKGAKVFLSNSYTKETVSIFGEPKKIINLADSVNSTAVDKGRRLEGLWVYE